jgi:hypothetical protein
MCDLSQSYVNAMCLKSLSFLIAVFHYKCNMEHTRCDKINIRSFNMNFTVFAIHAPNISRHNFRLVPPLSGVSHFLISCDKNIQGGSNMTGTNCDLFTHK